MAKIILNNIASSIPGASTINANNTRIKNAIENTLSRDGTEPNEMNSSLDMNDHRVYNLPEPNSDTEPVRKQDVDELIAAASKGIYATKSEAEAGLRNDKNMSPLRTKQSIDARAAAQGLPLSIKDFTPCNGSANDTAGFASWLAALSSSGRSGIIPAEAIVMLSPQTIPALSGDITVRCDGTLRNRDGASASANMLIINGNGANRIAWSGGRLDLNSGAFSGLVFQNFASAQVHIEEAYGIVCSTASPGSTSAFWFSNVRKGFASWTNFHDMEQGTAITQGSVPRCFSVGNNDGQRSDCVIRPGMSRSVHGVIVIGNMAGGTVDVFGGDSRDVFDNGVYNVGDASEVNVYDFRCDNIDEIFVNSGSGILNAYRPIGRNLKNSVGLQNCDAINVYDGDLHFAAGVAPFKLRGAAGVPLNVASKALRLYRNRIRCRPLARVVDLGHGANGTCEEFIDIGNRWEIEIDGAILTSPTIFGMSPGPRCKIDSDSDWIAMDAAGGTATNQILLINMPTVTEQSRWKRPPICLLSNASAGLRLNSMRQTLFTFSGAFSVNNIQSEREANFLDRAKAPPRDGFGSTAPSSGAWRAGDFLRNPNPSDFGSFGFLCVADGSPGTWREVGIAPRILKGTVTLDLPSIAAGAVSAAFTVPVSGAITSDVVLGLSLAVADVNITFHGKVSSSNTVTAYARNNAASPVDLASATVTALVMKT